MTEYLTVVELLAIHDRMLQDFGGAAGIRDGGALESALYRPQTGYYADVIAEAAALFESLVQNHPFVDGNKRVAFAAMDIFLRLNGHALAVDEVEAHEFIVGGLERGNLDRDLVDDWIRHHVPGRGTEEALAIEGTGWEGDLERMRDDAPPESA